MDYVDECEQKIDFRYFWWIKSPFWYRHYCAKNSVKRTRPGENLLTCRVIAQDYIMSLFPRRLENWT